MQIIVPPLMLPPLTAPPSVSHQVNVLLDQVHYHLQKLELTIARKRLFEAYIQFQLNDALLEEKKAYFFIMNGYILFLMAFGEDYEEVLESGKNTLQIPEENAKEFMNRHLMQHAVLSFINAIDILEPKGSVERATPRLYLGFMYNYIQNYDKATVFFKQAEAIALSVEGTESILYNIASYNLLCLTLSEFIMYVNLHGNPTGTEQKGFYGNVKQLDVYANFKTNPRFGPNFDLSLTNNYKMAPHLQTTINQSISQEADKNKPDIASILFELGKNIDITKELHDKYFSDTNRYEPKINIQMDEEKIYASLLQSRKIKKTLYTILGDHQYYQQACQLEQACLDIQKSLGDKITEPRHITAGVNLTNFLVKQKTKDEMALESYYTNFSKIPKRPLVNIPKKKGKK